MRYDCFIIWGNGLQNIPEIVGIIRGRGGSEKYNIIRIVKKDIGYMSRFIKKVYACDTVPWRHLRAKSRYLLKSPRQCIFILVENKNPNERYVGDGKFRHLQCQNIDETKRLIRSKYNPKFDDAEKTIAPLPPGISHDHCIHATDYESQVEYLLGYFKLKNLEFYRRNDQFSYYIPWHISIRAHNKITETEMDIKHIYANIDKTPRELADTPHYKYVSGDKVPYTNYFNKNFGTVLQDDHFPEAFDILLKNFDENYRREDGKKSFVIINDKNVIKDGVHRASILKKLGKQKITCIQIS